MEHRTIYSVPNLFSSEDWFYQLEEAVRFQVCAFIEALEEEG